MRCVIIGDMGRHARGALRSRVTVKAVLVAVPVALIVAAGSWWAASATASSAETVTGSAVVISSLACHNGDEGTVVDVLGPVGQPPGTTRRATMDSCGHQPGEVLTVHYPTADPGRVVPAAAADPGSDPSGRMLPLGLMLASLLGVAALAAVVRDARRAPSALTPDGSAAAPNGTGRGRHARAEDDDDHPPAVEPVDEAPHPSELDVLFPAHDNLRDSLHDELFTHRSTAGV